MNKQEAKWNYRCDVVGCSNKNKMTKRGLALHKKHKHSMVAIGGVAKGIAHIAVAPMIEDQSGWEVTAFKMEPPQIDNPIRPAHYRVGQYEAKDILNAFFPNDPLAWNAGKYLLRMGRKSSVAEDAKKAIQYLTWLVEREEEKGGE